MKVEDCAGRDYVLDGVVKESPETAGYFPGSFSGVWK
jgi:hypothetical protein